LSRFYAERTQTLVIQSEESRKQAANVESCYEKLLHLLKTTAEDVIPGETSEEQREKVQKMYDAFLVICIIYRILNSSHNCNRKRAENEARIKAKKLHSSKKSNRRGNKYDE
jgi:peptidyl-tRNA hydrolase ICT1